MLTPCNPKKSYENRPQTPLGEYSGLTSSPVSKSSSRQSTPPPSVDPYKYQPAMTWTHPRSFSNPSSNYIQAKAASNITIILSSPSQPRNPPLSQPYLSPARNRRFLSNRRILLATFRKMQMKIWKASLKTKESQKTILRYDLCLNGERKHRIRSIWASYKVCRYVNGHTRVMDLWNLEKSMFNSNLVIRHPFSFLS